MQGTVYALFVVPDKKSEPVFRDEVEVSACGFDGDFHGNPASPRQILILSESVLREFQLQPGSLSENLVVSGLDVMALRTGHRLQIGKTVLEVTMPCEPCIQMERIRSGLKKALAGRRGMFAKVIQSGVIRVGDTVTA